MRWSRTTLETASARRDDGLRVEPVRLAGRRARGPLVLAGLFLALVAAGVVEPWELGRADDIAPPPIGTPAPSQPAGRGHSPGFAAEGPPAGGTALDPSAGDDLRAAATPRESWGLRAIARRIGSGVTEALMLADRWEPIDPPAAGADSTGRAVQAGATGDAILALEVTTPPDALVLDLRAWRIDASGARQPVAPRPVRGPDTGTTLWLPDLAGMTDANAWPAGRYRLDVLIGPTVVPIALTIPGEPDVGTLPFRAPPPASELLARISSWIGLAQDIDHLSGAPVITARDLGGTDGDGTCGGSARITPFDELVGLVDAPGRRVTAIRVFALDTIRRPDLRVRFASDPVSGLTVVALPHGGLAPRQYALVATSEGVRGSLPAERTYAVCVA